MLEEKVKEKLLENKMYFTGQELNLKVIGGEKILQDENPDN